MKWLQVMEHTLNKDCWQLYKVLSGCFPHKTHNNSKPDLTSMCYHLPKVKLLIKLGKSLFTKRKRLCDDSSWWHFQKSGRAKEKMESRGKACGFALRLRGQEVRVESPSPGAGEWLIVPDSNPISTHATSASITFALFCGFKLEPSLF